MFNRKLLNLSVTTLLGAALLQSPLLHAEEWPAPIKKIEAKGAKIIGSFDAPSGMRGYAAQYQNRGMALYLTPDGKNVLVGNLYDANGNDLSLAPLQKLVYEPMAKQVWANMEKSNWIADGKKMHRASFTCSATRTARTATCSGNRPGHGSIRAKCNCATSWSASSAKTARQNLPHCWLPKTLSKPCTNMSSPAKPASSSR